MEDRYEKLEAKITGTKELMTFKNPEHMTKVIENLEEFETALKPIDQAMLIPTTPAAAVAPAAPAVAPVAPAASALVAIEAKQPNIDKRKDAIRDLEDFLNKSHKKGEF